MTSGSARPMASSIPGYEIKGTGQRGTLLQLVKDGSNKLTLQPEPVAHDRPQDVSGQQPAGGSRHGGRIGRNARSRKCRLASPIRARCRRPTSC